jgi:hypothetical protein
VLKEDAEAAGCYGHEEPQKGLAGILGARDFGGCQVPIEMSLGGRMAGAESAPGFRFSAAHGTAHRQLLP